MSLVSLDAADNRGEWGRRPHSGGSIWERVARHQCSQSPVCCSRGGCSQWAEGQTWHLCGYFRVQMKTRSICQSVSFSESTPS